MNTELIRTVIAVIPGSEANMDVVPPEGFYLDYSSLAPG